MASGIWIDGCRPRVEVRLRLVCVVLAGFFLYRAEAPDFSSGCQSPSSASCSMCERDCLVSVGSKDGTHLLDLPLVCLCIRLIAGREPLKRRAADEDLARVARIRLSGMTLV